MYKHFLITRFNVPFEMWDKDKAGEVTRDSKWLEQRFSLFDRFCFPSVANQYNQNFRWLVFFDVNTPSFYKNKIDGYKQFCPIFTPCYVNSIDAFFRGLKSEINKYLSPGTKFLITSRLDNDDALHKRYINEIQKNFNPVSDLVLNFKYGHIYDIAKSLLYVHSHESNHFISRIESLEDAGYETVMLFNHTEATMSAPVKQLDEICGWMTVVHERNLVNRASGRPLFFPERVFADYSIECPHDKFNMDFDGLIRYFLKYLGRKLLP